MTEQKTHMEKSVIIHELETIVKRFKTLKTEWEKAEKEFKINLDGALGQAVWWAFEDYTRLVIEKIGANTEDEGWVHYFLYDNHCGKGVDKSLNTVEKLADRIIESQREEMNA
jgi:hypothetical protein